MGVMGAEEVEGGGAILDCNLLVGVGDPCFLLGTKLSY